MDNVKGRLQELFQGRGVPLPRYEVKSSGPSHCPVVECTVTVWWDGHQLRERVQCHGAKKRDVEKLAAGKMLQTLQRGKRGADSPPPRLDPRRVAREPDDQAAVSPARSPHGPGGGNPVAILQERLQAMRLSLPSYSEARPKVSAFRVRCQVKGEGRLPDLLTEGEGRSKNSAKEAAARDMLRKMEGRYSNVALAPDPPGAVHQSEQVAPHPPGVTDHEDLTAAKLASLSPTYHYWHAQEAMLVCCLASVEGVGGVAYPITGHGWGETEAAAQRQADLSLLASFDALTET